MPNPRSLRLAAAALVAALGACKAADFSGSTAVRPISKKGDKPAAPGSDKPIMVPVGETVPIPGASGASNCTPKDPAVVDCKSGEVTGKEPGTTTVKIGDQTVTVVSYDPKNPPPGLPPAATPPPAIGSQSLYVPLGGASPLPTIGGQAQNCVSADPHIAGCANGAVIGSSLGTTSVTLGGQSINVIVYDPHNPPGGVPTLGGGSGLATTGLGGTAGSAIGGGGLGANGTGVGGLGASTGLDASTGGGRIQPLPGSLNDQNGALAVSGTEPLILEQLLEGQDDADDNMVVTVMRIDMNGTPLSGALTFPFQEHKAAAVTVPDFCNKNGASFLAVSFADQDSKVTMTPDSKSGGGLFGGPQPLVARTGGGANNPEVTVDDGKCGLGACVDRGSDNTFRFTCPRGTLTIKGLQ